jgi:hypothetical protein
MKTFTLTDAQEAKYEKWCKSHRCRAEQTTIGGKYTFHFTPTGAGETVDVTCVCGKKLELTEWENW